MPRMGVLVAGTFAAPDSDRVDESADLVLDVLEDEFPNDALGPAVSADLAQGTVELRFSIDGESMREIDERVGAISERIFEAVKSQVRTETHPLDQVEATCA